METGTQHPVVTARHVATPFVTYAVIAICVAIHIYLNAFQDSNAYNDVVFNLAPDGIGIWMGAYWGLLTSAFVHFAFWHFLFNMWWTRDFGRVLEPTMGRARYLLLILASAVVSSGAQLAFSEQTGIGFSGVVYALFGYMLAVRHMEPRYRWIIDKRTIGWLLGWLILCIVLSALDILNIGNAAHVAGLLFGYCVGNALVARTRVIPSRIGLAVLILLPVLSSFYMPWSESWRERQEYASFRTVMENAESGNAEAQFDLANVMLFLAEDNTDKTEGVSLLKKSAAQGFVPAMNALAWTLATDTNDAMRAGEEAVTWAESACKEDGWKTAGYVDTLAAAYAESERWEEAVATQRTAIEKLTDEDAEEKTGFESRLEKYLKQEKYRE